MEKQRIKNWFRYGSLANFASEQASYFKESIGSDNNKKTESYRASRKHGVTKFNGEIQRGKTNDYYLEQLQKAVSAMPSTKAPLRPVIKTNVVGYAPSVGKYLTGHPRNMFKRAQNQSPTPSLKLAVSIEASGMVGPNQIANRAAAILSMIQSYENKGIKVHVDLVFTVPSEAREQVAYGNDAHVITVKRYNEKLSLPELTYLCDERMLRGLGFVCIERSEHNLNDELTDANYGYPQKYDNKLTGYDVFIESILGQECYQFSSPEQALETIKTDFEHQTKANTKAA